MSCIFVFDVFLRLVVFVVTRVCSLTHAKAQKDNAKRKASRKTKQQKIKLILPEFERYLFAVEWWAGGCPVFCCFCFYRRLFVVRLFCCFCLVFLSLCMYKRKTIVNTKNKSSRKATTNNNTAHPAGTWKIFIRGRVVGWMSCISFFLSRRFCFVFVVLLIGLFLPSLFKCLPEHNTIHYTKHKHTWNRFVHDLCQMPKVMFKLISNYMTFAADLKSVFVALK